MLIPSVEILLNPAVLGVIEANKEFINLSINDISAIVFELLCSNKNINIAPPKTNTVVIKITIFE